MSTLTAIQTAYKGYRFRSRLEARWAVYFDAIGCRWEYESEGFELPSGWYLPDFWLSGVDMWAEVKPRSFTPVEAAKCVDLATHSGYPVLQLIGTPALTPYWAFEPDLQPGLADEAPRPFECDYVLDDLYLGRKHNEHRFFCSTGDMRGDVHDLAPDYWPAAARAVDAARAARFER